MENQSSWKAKIALACYLALAGGILLGGVIVGIILLGMGLDYQELTFPIALISLPINEGIILGITLIFAIHKGASLRKLGLKKPSHEILLLVSVAAVFLIMLAVTISVIEEFILTSFFSPSTSFRRIATGPFSSLSSWL